MGAIREIRKRDDRVVPFDGDKITDAIFKAVRSVGHGTRADAERLGAAVVRAVEERFEGRIPGIEDIQDIVEEVLIDSGHAAIAKAYILYRNKRAMLRETLQVCKIAPSAGEGQGPWVEELREGVTRWSKSKITAALLREADMDPGIAEEVASAVERKVFDSGIQRISTALVRELVDNELFERGYDAKLKRQLPLGLPKYDLEQAILGLGSKEGGSFPSTPVAVRDFIADRVLRQYALQEVYAPAVADAHRDGRLHLHRLSEPIRFDEVGWDLPFPLLGRGDTGGPTRSRLVSELERALDTPAAADPAGRESWVEIAGQPERVDAFLDCSDFFRKLVHLGQFVIGEMRLRSVDRLLVEPRHPARRGLTAVDRVTAILDRLAELPGALPSSFPSIELRPGEASLPWLDGLLARDGGVPVHFVWTPEEILDPRSRPSVDRAADLFSRGGAVEFMLGVPADHRHPAVGAGRLGDPPRRSGLVARMAKITVNLPRAAFRSVRRRSGRIEEELDEVIDLALKALVERRQFLARLGSRREGPLWDVLGRPQDATGAPLIGLDAAADRIGLLGLNECVKFLTGHEFHEDARAVEKGRELVAAVRRKIGREARGLGLRVELEETPATESVSRFEVLDRQTFPQFDEIDRGREGVAAGYTGGVRIHPAAAVDPLRRLEHLARFVPEVVPRGLLDESPELRHADGALVVCLLEEAAHAFVRQPV